MTCPLPARRLKTNLSFLDFFSSNFDAMGAPPEIAKT
eukprot:CAMPEP_0184974976 /NCGR_PEP_ID=MMETSP1098-20130426/6327_1 /TAXON_ID=89044 /ORGANISM="Spumella elongata, Strain CCAP 955/1" /LENGTH=36 /DNA_ID= /DNA_START= /DNA_END= /DNA_ORIENTATION=